MITQAQYERMAVAAPTARAIVDTDRAIAAITDRVVTPFGRAERADLRALLQDRRVLTTRAEQIWGRPLRNDGTALA